MAKEFMNPKKVLRTNKFRAIHSSCNGLVLVGTYNDIFLWNPLTGYFKKVLHYEPSYFKVFSGLCYDSSADEYKVVKVLDFGKSVVGGSFKDKTWRHVECSFFSNMMLSFNSGPTVNERLYWYITCEKDFKSEYSQILYFDPQPGTFKGVPMPQPKQSDGDLIHGLGVLDRCLCMSRSENPSNYECNYIEVLVMKEYGVANSWSLMIIVSNLTPFGYTKNGKALALKLLPGEETTGVWHVRVYNPRENSATDIPIPTRYRCNAIIYEESLIKPADCNWKDEEDEAAYEEYFLDGSHKKWKRDTCWRCGYSGWTQCEGLIQRCRYCRVQTSYECNGTMGVLCFLTINLFDHRFKYQYLYC